jgi:hypothetical protein
MVWATWDYECTLASPDTLPGVMLQVVATVVLEGKV